jgi:hypothetical protein
VRRASRWCNRRAIVSASGSSGTFPILPARVPSVKSGRVASGDRFRRRPGLLLSPEKRILPWTRSRGYDSRRIERSLRRRVGRGQKRNTHES